MKDFKNLSKLVNEIEYLKKSHELLEQVGTLISPYEKGINCQPAEKLIQEIHQHLSDFDDSE